MKVLAFSDIHLDEYALRQVKNNSSKHDLLICAGDLSRMGNGLKQMIEFLGEIEKEVLIVPGNNDPLRRTQELSQQQGLTYIHGTTVKRSGYNFSGLGAGLPGIKSPFELTEDEMNSVLNSFKGIKKQVLITHTPPKGPLGQTRFGEDIGSQSVLEFIKKEQPLLCLCGHVHETAGQEASIGKTRVINVGKHGKTINL